MKTAIYQRNGRAPIICVLPQLHALLRNLRQQLRAPMSQWCECLVHVLKSLTQMLGVFKQLQQTG